VEENGVLGLRSGLRCGHDIKVEGYLYMMLFMFQFLFNGKSYEKIIDR
jgi:hypothetical protein